MRKLGMLLAMTLVTLQPMAAGAIEFFADDFESYATTADVENAGWVIFDTPAVTETEARWELFDTATVALLLGLPDGIDFGPANATGGTSPGQFLVSFSGLLPDDIEEGPDNLPYSGASNNVTTPSFSTVGATGDVWMHADVTAQLKDNGDAIFDLEMSLDGGVTWDQKFQRIAPGRTMAPADTDTDRDVDGRDFLNGVQLGGASLSDWRSQFGSALANNTNAGGYHGHLDLNLGPLGDQADVRIRIRHFEQTDDESVSFDNFVINEIAAPTSASTEIFLEDFNSLSLGQMGVYEYEHLGGFFGFDSGEGGAISGFSWGAEDRTSDSRPNGRYQAGVVGNKNVNRLGHPTAKGANGEVPFAIIDSAVEGEFGAQSERLHTPILDLSGMETIILEWDEEVIYDGNPALGSVASVVLMQDDGDGIPNAADSVINEPDKFAPTSTALFDPYMPYDQFAGGLFSGGDDPIFGHRLLDITDLVADATDPSSVYIAFQYVSADTDYWAVDNIRLTGEPLPVGAHAVPEPTSIVLAGMAILAMGGAVRRRKYCFS